MAVLKVATIDEYEGLAGDTKPTGVRVWSRFTEHDTSKVFRTHDGTNWVQIDPLVSIVAGTNRIGTVSGVLKEVNVTKALEAAVGYSANDVLSESDTPSAGTAWTFSAIARANGASGYITKAQVISESESVIPRLTLFLFNATPTSELDDNAANTAPDSADLATYIGAIDFPALESLGTTDSHALSSPSTVGNLPLAFTCDAGADDLFGILVTRDAFTQTATDDMTVKLTAEQY